MSSRQVKETHIPEVQLYSFPRMKEESLVVSALLSKYQELVEEIQSYKKKTPTGWENIRPIPPELLSQVNTLRDELRKHSGTGGNQRNILRNASFKDKLVGNGKDNRVYQHPKDSYVYKESAMYGSPENILFLRGKYSLLKRYLGPLIPQSRFILGEVLRNQQINKKIGNIPVFETRAITIQRKIRGKSLQAMSIEEREHQDLLSSLKIAHQKYVLFKMFVSTVLRELNLPEDTFDVKMDIGPISNIDTLDVQDPSTIKNNLTSPNIMWDGTNIHFIDFDFGSWDTAKETLFKTLLKDSYIQRWNEMLRLFGITT